MSRTRRAAPARTSPAERHAGIPAANVRARTLTRTDCRDDTDGSAGRGMSSRADTVYRGLWMAGAGRCTALMAAVVTLLVVWVAPSASADSLVYMQGGEVWISHADGSDAKQVTGQANNWSWPTEDDAGNILAAGGQGGVRAGVEDTPGSEIYRISQQGAELSSPQQTPGSMSTVGCVTYAPRSLRVAPDGRHYAYDSFFCGQFITQIGTVGGAGFSGSEYMSNFVFPSWVDNSDFVVSRGGQPLVDSDGEWWTHDVGDQADHGFNWFGDPASYAEPGNPDGWATGFDGIAVSRDGTKVATVEEDAGNWTDGAARKVAIRLWSAAGAPTVAHSTVTTPTFQCELDLPGDPGVTAWYDNAGPSFSPDGTQLAFAEPDGVHIANVASLANCAAITAPLVIPGATQPFWSAADEAANAGYVAQNNDNNNNGGDTTAPVIRGLTIRPHRFAVTRGARRRGHTRGAHRGATVTYTVSEPARVTFAVQAITTGRKKGTSCVKATARLRHARRCVLVLPKGTLTQGAHGGSNQLSFSGRMGRRSLPPGHYRLTVTAADPAGNLSAVKTVTFTIVKP